MADHNFNLRYMAASFTPELQPDGTYTIRRVPIFECHTRQEGNKKIVVDHAWMYQCVKDQKAKAAQGYYPKIIIGHNSDDPNAPERPVVAPLDNYEFDPITGFLYADYVNLAPEALPLLKKYPARSAEASWVRPEINTVAILGGTPPWFKLPDMRFSEANAETFKYSMELKMDMPQQQGQPTSSPEEDADYQKFCKYFLRMKGDSKYAEAFGQTEKPEEKPAEEAPKKDDEGNPPEKKKDDTMNASDATSTAKYAELETKVATLLEGVASRDAQIAELLEVNERSKWTAKYAEKRIPGLKVSEELEFLMELPAAKREKAFDRSVARYAAPSAKPNASLGAAQGKPEPGSQAESEAVAKYAAENTRGKGMNFKGFAEAQAHYIKTQR